MAFGGQPCMQSALAASEIQRAGKPIPPELSRCNSWWNPLGAEPARGWFIMQRRDINKINLNALQDWVWQFEDQENTPKRPLQTRTLKSLVICKEPLNLTPSNVANDPDSIFLVEVADSRWRAFNPYFQANITKYYNVRAGAWQQAGSTAAEFMTGSLNSGALWTWQTMFADVWGAMATQLGPAPTLPFTPDGTPEGFIFLSSAWQAVTEVLTRIGCAVSVDHTKNQGEQFTVARVGEEDGDAEDILRAAEDDDAKIHDAEWIPIARGLFPASVQVNFHRKEAYPGEEETTPRDSTQWLTQSVYSVTVAGTNANAEPGLVHQIWDDLPAIYDNSGLLNGSALNTRAAERVADFYRLLGATGGQRLTKRYSGLLPLVPGSSLKGVAYREDPIHAAGVFTEVIRHPFLNLRVADSGHWLERTDEGNTKLRSPDFPPTVPVYPQLIQWLNISSASPSGIYYTATVERYDHATPGFIHRESVFAVEPNGTALGVGRYMGRLVDFTTKPVYAVVNSGAASGAGGDDLNSFRNLAAGTFYGMPVTGQSIIPTAPPAINTIAAVWFPSPRSVSLAKIGVFLANNGSAGTKLRVGIYDIADPDHINPRNLVVDGGDLDTSSGQGGFVANTISFTTAANTGYWLVVRWNGITVVPNINWVSNVMEYAILGRLADGTAAFWYLATLDPSVNPYGALPATAADWLLGTGTSLAAQGTSAPDVVVSG